MAIVTLLTDFGTQDEYAGVLKGVILSINAAATLVDLTHHIGAQDVMQAAYMLKSAYGYFPKGTTHLAVVDPGVGSRRNIIAARQAGHYFIAPDNGLLGFLWEQEEPAEMVRVENSALFLHPISRTFHGRDILAPAAAHISLGLALNELGPPLSRTDVVDRALPQPKLNELGELEGEVIAVDRFGNLITNIQDDHLMAMQSDAAARRMVIKAGKLSIRGLSDSYSQVAVGTALAVMGSRKYLEIAVNRQSAAQRLKMGKGTRVRVCLRPERA